MGPEPKLRAPIRAVLPCNRKDRLVVDYTRRQLLCSGVGVGLALATGAAPILAHPQRVFDLKSRRTSFQFAEHMTEGLVSLADNAPPPVLRVRLVSSTGLASPVDPGELPGCFGILGKIAPERPSRSVP